MAHKKGAENKSTWTRMELQEVPARTHRRKARAFVDSSW